jgi:hypothetical protein
MTSRVYTDLAMSQASKVHRNDSRRYPATNNTPSSLSLSTYSSTSGPYYLSASTYQSSTPVFNPHLNIPYTQDLISPSRSISSSHDSPIDSPASRSTTDNQRLAPHFLRSFPQTMTTETENAHPGVIPFSMTQESSVRYSFVRGHTSREVTVPNIASNPLIPSFVTHNSSFVRHANSYPPLHTPSVVHNFQTGHLPPIPYTTNTGNVLLSNECTTTSPQELTEHLDADNRNGTSTVEVHHWDNTDNAAANTAGTMNGHGAIIPVSPESSSQTLPILNSLGPSLHRGIWRPGFHGQPYQNPSPFTNTPIPVVSWSQTNPNSWTPTAPFPISASAPTFDPLRGQLPSAVPSLPRRRTTFPPQQPYAFIEESNNQMDYSTPGMSPCFCPPSMFANLRPHPDPSGRTHAQRPTVGQSWSGHTGREEVEGQTYANISLAARSNRPPVAFRRRSSISAGVGTSLMVKRKPLPKIYGCDTCGKKFDRPSTLKVVCTASFFLSPSSAFILITPNRPSSRPHDFNEPTTINAREILTYRALLNARPFKIAFPSIGIAPAIASNLFGLHPKTPMGNPPRSHGMDACSINDCAPA